MSKIKPKEITKDSETGTEYASFSYYDGIAYAKENNLSQAIKIGHLNNPKLFIVCCGDVMIKCTPDFFPEIQRKII